MAKVKTQYVCTNCGKVEYSWMGQCLSCNEWNTFEEKIVNKSGIGSVTAGKSVLSKTVRKISELKNQEQTNFRIKNFSYEIDRVLGGGFFKGGLYLFGGEPGIGKSTLCLEILKFLNEINPIIKQYMTDNQISIIIDKKNIYIADKKFDFTNNLIELINKKIK